MDITNVIDFSTNETTLTTDDVTQNVPKRHIPARFVTLVPKEFTAFKVLKLKKQKHFSVTMATSPKFSNRDESGYSAAKRNEYGDYTIVSHGTETSNTKQSVPSKVKVHKGTNRTESNKKNDNCFNGILNDFPFGKDEYAKLEGLGDINFSEKVWNTSVSHPGINTKQHRMKTASSVADNTTLNYSTAAMMKGAKTKKGKKAAMDIVDKSGVGQDYGIVKSSKLNVTKLKRGE